MLNQATVEALYSANYLENYLNCVDQLPDDLQRLISRARELDVTYRAFLLDARQQQEIVFKCCDSMSKKKSGLIKIQQLLISAQEIGDDKLEIIQQIQDIIENKARQLDTDCRNLVDIGKEQENHETARENGNINQTNATTTTNNNNNTTSNVGNNNGNLTGERSSKRMRRTRNDTAQSMENSANNDAVPTPEPLRQTQQTQQQSTPVSTTSSSQKKTQNQNTGKKKKRKSRQSSQHQQQQQQQQREESPPHEDEMAIDPDEPTYCLCHQISYGEMIMCDNDLCPYEWFHFSCVSLSIKPKGKWYCPKCRGDRSSIMKPRAQFLKELDRYNKEKELRDEKGS